MTGNRIDLSAALWRKSSYSNGSGADCVEVADSVAGIVPVRDSKSPEGPVVIVGAPAWSAFIGLVTHGS
jgi:hypothetical protein